MKPDRAAMPAPAGDIDIFHARLLADQQISYVLEFAGSLDVGMLNSSVGALHESLPILSRVLQVRGRSYRWVPAASYRPGVAVVNAGNDQPNDQLLRFVSAPCDPLRLPPLRLVLFRSAAGRDTLCVKIDHVASDAAGLKIVIHLLAQAYTHGRITQPVSANRGLGQVLRRFSPLTLARSALTAQLPRPARALIAGPFDTGSAFIERVRVEPVQFAAVIAAARNFGATVNDVMLTALYRVVRERAGEAVAAAYPVMVPVDTRRYLPEAQRWTVANLASAVFPQLRGRDGDSFQESLIRVKACMDAYKQNRPGVGTLVLMSMAAVCGGSILRNRYRRAAAGDTRFINLTNFGVLEDGHCRFGDLVPADTYGVGPNEFAPGLLIAISSYQGALQLVVHGNDAHRFGPFARDFLNGIVTELTSNP